MKLTAGAGVTEYDWQAARKRVDAPAGLQPLQGFGPDGRHTLWLPSPIVTRKAEFHDGKPVIVFVGALLDDPELMELRKSVTKLCRSRLDVDGMRAILTADLTLLEYSAALIRRVYTVSDDDLGYLHSGKKWMDAVLGHAMGGDEAKESWRRASTMMQSTALQFAAELGDSGTMVAGPEFPAAPQITDLAETAEIDEPPYDFLAHD